MYSCSEFHKELAGRPNLVFIFAAESMVVGSFFSCPYPAGEATASDPTSFIFTVRQDPAVKILKFLANSDSAYHIEVSERFLVSHGGLPTEEKGLGISCDALDSLEVALPSESFVAENTAEEEINETVRLSQILVLQVGPCDS